MKKLIYVGLGLLIIVGLVIANSNMTNDAVDKCVSTGHSYNYCVEGLVK